MKKTLWCFLLLLIWVGHSWAYQNAEELAVLKQKAEAGYAQEQAALGDYYANVYEDSKRGADYPQAIIWYEKAAEQGEAYSQVTLAHLFYDGTAVPRDLAKALKWAEASAKVGINDTRILLAHMYKNGEGVAADAQKAYALFYASLQDAYAEQRPYLAKEMADLEKVLSKAQIAAAKKATEQH